jgi:membrane dipeptidase
MNLIPVFDGHNDTLTECFSPETGEKRSFFLRSDTGHLDYPRAAAGGFKGGIFAIFTPPPADSPDRDLMSGVTFTDQGYEVSPRGPVEHLYARAFTNAVIAYAQRLEAESGGKIGIVRTSEDISRFFAEDKLALVIHVEGAEAIREDLSNLEWYYQQGVRSLGLVWSRPNGFGEGVPFRYPSSPDTGSGLTAAGKDLVRACNRLGILVDLAHINEKGFWDAVEILTTPLVVSHAAVHAICPSSRNLTDAQIDAVGRSGGLIGIMFEPINLVPRGRLDAGVSLGDVVQNIDYVVQRIGIDHVGFGSDMDGADMPGDFRDASFFPQLVQALQARGYQGEDLEKIAYKNWLRVLQQCWKR